MAGLMVLGGPCSVDLGLRSDRGRLFGGTLVGLLALAVWVGSARWRGRKGACRDRYAIRHHVDPGPELLEAADAYREQNTLTPWVPWLQPLIWLPQLARGRSGGPGAAVPGAVLLVSGLVGVLMWLDGWSRRAGAGSAIRLGPHMTPAGHRQVVLLAAGDPRGYGGGRRFRSARLTERAVSGCGGAAP